MEDEKILMVLEAYKAYFRNLAFEELPRIAKKYLGPDAGFVEVSEVMARATARELPHLIRMVGSSVDLNKDPLEVLELHYGCHKLARAVAHDDEIALLTPKREGDDRLVLESSALPKNLEENPLVAASYAGVVVGVLRALGCKARAMRRPELRKHMEAGTYAVWVEVGKDSFRVVVERIR